MARRLSSGRRRAGSVRRRLLPHRRTLRVEPLEARLCLSAAQLVGHWTFDNVLDDTIDDSASDFDGMKMNGGPTTGIAGVLGEAAGFAGGSNNGDHEYVDLGLHAGTFGLLETGTISAWVKPERLPGIDQPADVFTIFSVSNSAAASQEMRFFVNNSGDPDDPSSGVGRLSYGVRGGTAIGHIHSTNNHLFDGGWHHVAVTVGAGNTAQIYIDGNLEGSGTRSFMSGLTANASAIGRNKDNTGGGGQWFFRGAMDDVGLWDDALTTAEVNALVSLARHPQLNYDLGQAEELFNLSDTGFELMVGGRQWIRVVGLNTDEGVVVADSNGALLLNLGDGVGVRAPAVPLVVSSTADVGPGTLRAMIDHANSTTGHDTMTFDPSVNGRTLLMNLGEMVITDAVTIDATSLANGFTIDAGNGVDGVPATRDGFRIFSIDDGVVGAGINVELIGLTLTGGDPNDQGGGAINSSENLTIRASTLSGNHSPFDGGAINFGGTLTILDSTLSGNSGAEGGAIRAVGSLVVENSTLSGNQATLGGGGAIQFFNISSTIRNSTITDNSAATDGGGIAGVIGAITIRNSIVAGNTDGGAAPDLWPGSGVLTVDYSLIGNTTGSSVTAGTGTGNLLNIEPRLGPLANNGGPTKTHILLPGSPAIDVGDPNFTPPPDFDQRGTGFPRVIDSGGDAIDMGAFEYASLVVDTLVDENDGDFSPGNFSLREAIARVAADPSINIIAFAQSLSGGTITLMLGEMSIAASMTIAATSLAAPVRIDADQQSRIFDIDGPADKIDVTIAGLTLTGGHVADNGGAIRKGSTVNLTILQSTVTGNSADIGGGIHGYGNVMLTQSTVSGNSALIWGGGIYAENATLTQSTVSGNSAGNRGGGIFALGSLTLTQSTVSGNSAVHTAGGIDAVGSGDTTLSGSIVAGNTAGRFWPDAGKTSGSITANYSLIGDGSGASIDNDGTSQVGTSAAPIDPRLGPLADNGGPTQTHTLLAGSPAIDAGDPATMAGVSGVPAFDQRGAPFQRVSGPAIDIGAVEAVQFVVDTLVDDNDGDYSSGNFSLREAIELTNADVALHMIGFATSLSGQTIKLGGTELVIRDTLTIDATSLAAPVTIDAQQQSRIFTISGPGNDFDVTIAGLTLTRGQTTGNNPNRSVPTFSGGAIRSLSTGELTIEHTNIRDSRTTGSLTDGGGIFSSGKVTLTDSTVSGNSASESGGGIDAFENVTLNQSTVSGNFAAHGGGISIGIGNAVGNVTLNQSAVSGNSTLFRGGGIWAGGTVTLNQSTVSGNSATEITGRGSGIYASGDVTLNQSTVSGNSAQWRGGGIFASAIVVTLSGSIVAGNTAGSGPDLLTLGATAITAAHYSLIGDDSNAAINDLGGSLIGTGDNPIDPLLGPLADNGGPTLTHALLHGSPALDAGDPDAVAGMNGVPEFDQRGLARVVDGGVDGVRIDMGAYEAQAPPPVLPGDYNENGVVDAADYVLWRNVLGDTGLTPFSSADGNGDGDITDADYGVWRANFGKPPNGAGNGATATAAIDDAIASDAPAATSSEPAFRKSAASDNGIDQAATDVALLFDFAATSASRVANSRLPNVERAVPTAARSDVLLLVLSPTDEAISNEPSGLMQLAPEWQPATDQPATFHLAFDTWFAELCRSPL